MKTDFEIWENNLYIRLPGDLDCSIAQGIRETADNLIEKNRIRKVVFDFDKTRFMDSTGIGVIIGRYKMMKTIKGDVEAINVDTNVSRLMYMAGLKELISIYEK